MERLYQPDFSSIFGKPYSNAFSYRQIDSLIWPIFSNIGRTQYLQNLLDLKDQNNRNCFYYRNISLEDHLIELLSSNIVVGLVQAMNLSRSYGIDNKDVSTVLKSNSIVYKAIYSFDLGKDHISELIELEKTSEIAGIVLYPSFIQKDLTDKSNQNQRELFEYCKHKNYFIKVDLGNNFLPENDPSFINYDKVKLLLSREPEIIFILSGIDFSGNFAPFYELMKLYRNLWLEIDPRNIGGITPKKLFYSLFQIPGFIQNLWNRITIGSATPTLEISQMYHGFIEASEDLRFGQKNLLRTWSFRNINRINSKIFTPEFDPDIFYPIKSIEKITKVETQSEIREIYKINIRSYSIIQLIHISDVMMQIFNTIKEEYPEIENGQIIIRSNHTTTTLIINEHEVGNYLDLHYDFAEYTIQDSSDYLHTVGALENRADFNHFDHLIANAYGSRQIIVPIVNKQLKIGSREDFYVLVTFGPRTISLLLDIRLDKQL